ncbi:hypothetical protein [Clostridium scatologenes]|uniref:Uncharacterized protein n=1 Tax=Clostridium scatologenes TaxID=1548 RepID=A0A0E3M824_CLOSL|nr:hypothetical protein [Clostridium scatologenes]AKA67809.1 hypothetical protein CSCA_0684 [Clostridium scatologenes]
MKLKEVFGNIDTYVMCSTLNQIVNYIPIKLIEENNKAKLETIKIINLTVKNKSEKNSIFKRFDNEKWDENLKACLQDINIKDVNIERNELDISNKLGFLIQNENHEEEGEDELNNNIYKEEKTILWNITGGQRTTIIAIQKYIRENKRYKDYIMYLEGNSNKIIIGNFKKKCGFNYEKLEEPYALKYLNLQTVFKLAGFEINNYDKVHNFLKENHNENDDKEYKELEVCNKIYKYYKNLESDFGEYFRKNLPRLNKIKNGIDMKQLIGEIEKSKFGKKFKEEFNDDQKKILENLKRKDKNKGSKADEQSKKDNESKNKQFGYILEYMAINSIKDCIKEDPKLSNYFIELCHSVNLKKLKNPLVQSKTSELCEFDLVLLSKSGQVVIFECKSGTMSSDVGKARQYTGYAAAGVYGKPILITPLLENHRRNICNAFKTNSDNSNLKAEKTDEICSESQKFDEAVLEAFRAAARANLDVWGMDEIHEKLNELYYEVLNVGEKNE